jgi:hypothetical protein
MYYNDHSPPHFHAEYAGGEALFAIGDLRILRGGIARRARTLVIEWASAHTAELMTDWDLARRGLPLNAIDPPGLKGSTNG